MFTVLLLTSPFWREFQVVVIPGPGIPGCCYSDKLKLYYKFFCTVPCFVICNGQSQMIIKYAHYVPLLNTHTVNALPIIGSVLTARKATIIAFLL